MKSKGARLAVRIAKEKRIGETVMATLRIELSETATEALTRQAAVYGLTMIPREMRSAWNEGAQEYDVYVEHEFLHSSRERLISFASVFGFERWLALECSAE